MGSVLTAEIRADRDGLFHIAEPVVVVDAVNVALADEPRLPQAMGAGFDCCRALLRAEKQRSL